MKNEALKRCSIKVKDGLIIVEGSCANEIAADHAFLQAASRAIGREISFQECVDPSTGKVKKLVIDTVGELKSSELRNKRVCDSDQLQMSSHTHPKSGYAKFSDIDIQTVGMRLNDDVDNCGCVVGTVASKCFCGLVLPHSHSDEEERQSNLPT